MWKSVVSWYEASMIVNIDMVKLQESTQHTAELSNRLAIIFLFSNCSQLSRMDDDIDIEEHDILEHPQVKAVFPDISKIQIHLHASGASFLDEKSADHPVLENLLEERVDYIDNDIEHNVIEEDDLQKMVQEYENEEENYEDEILHDNVFVKEETHEISDSESSDVLQVPVTDNQQDIVEEGNVHDSEHEVNNIQVISEDENDELQTAVNKLTNENEEEMEWNGCSEDEAITKQQEDNLEECNISITALNKNVCKITDEVDSQELTKNCDGIIEKASEHISLYEYVPENNDFNKDNSKRLNGITEVPEDDNRFTEEDLESDAELTRENTDSNDATFEEYIEDEFVDRDMTIQDDVDLKYFSNDTELEEYQQISIKKEIEFELEDLTDIDATLPEETFNTDELPPEDIYHFKNKIILGSKPSPLMQGNLSAINKNSYLVVKLDDWSVYLNQSQSYCKDCRTLFSTSNALDTHRMAAHSLLTPLCTNRALKSTALSSVNVARKSTVNLNTTGKYKEFPNSTYCNHCNVTFKDRTALIKHLYELLPVKQYECQFCDATFQNQNDLVNHNSIHIKLERPRKYLKAKKSSDNPILRKMLSAKTDSSTLKRYYPVALKTAENLNSNKRSAEARKEPTTNQCGYKCLVCSDVFDSYSEARRHRSTHPGTPFSKMLKRLLTKRPNSNNSKDKLIYEEGNKKTKETSDNPFQLIPTGALFQCSKCDIHFPSSIAGQSHVTGNKCSDKNIWSCPLCRKKLRYIYKSCHTRQHELSSKIKIYKITRNTYERTLCKCLKCNVYFEYLPLRMHLRKCGKIPTAKCKTCNILFPSHKIEEHIKKHDFMKWKKKDFILVDYAVVKNKTKAARATSKSKKRTLLAKNIKQEPNITIKTEPGTTKINSKIVNKLRFEGEKLKLYFCKHCKCFLFRRNLHRSNKLHLSKQCVRLAYTTNCKHCGLQVFRKTRFSHEKLHVKKKLTLDDFAFYDFATLKPITPPVPKYPRCDKCKIHFLNKNMIGNHICGEDYDNCEVCGEKFENSALEVHLAIHRKLSAAPQLVSSHPKIIPELMMKYESLNAIWNILFICGKCELVTDVYNKAVEHSQAHLKKKIQTKTIKCYICNLKFDESCWPKHSELHSRMSLNNKDFKILKYTPKNLLDESWFQMFESLPEQEIRQIIDRSVFGSERSLKMRLVKDGLPEFTVYCCSSCHVSYDNNDIVNHVQSKCRASKHACRECGITFDSSATLHFHDLLHKKGIRTEEFRIVHFVKSNDSKTTLNEKDTSAKMKHVKKKTQLKINDKVTKKNAQFVLYKCKECTVCVHLKINLSYHVCAPDHHRTYCRLCKQNFSFRQMGAHRAKHVKQHEFRAKNINIISFEPMPECEDKPKYHDRTKGKRSTSKRAKNSLVNSVRIKKEPASLDDSEADSPSFGSLHPNISKNPKSKGRTTLNSCKQNDTRGSAESSEADQTEDVKTAKVYKCDCGLHYTSSRSIEKHIETCDSADDISKEYCSKCGLLFPTDILVSHLCKHHSHDTKLSVEEVHKRSPAAAVAAAADGSAALKASTALKDGIKLYKCSDCNVYFLNQSSCYKHTSKHVPLDPKEYIECKMCSFQFRILSLHIHMRRHHELEFNLEKVLVEEYQPSVGKQAPRIDIYFANDRFQNVQVSSSND